MKGMLYVFEGPDGVGKSTLAARLRDDLDVAGFNVALESFPGRNPGSVGEWVYSLHHDVKSKLKPNALQALHVAAHIDAVERIILPKLESGVSVILDRYYWSTIAYGRVFGAESVLLQHLVNAEKVAWGQVQPSVMYVIDRPVALRAQQTQANFDALRQGYTELSAGAAFRTVLINNVEDIESVAGQIFQAALRVAK